MDRFQAFLEMGGYAMFVWPAYADAISTKAVATPNASIASPTT